MFHITVPDKFPFPFPPYNIQEDFMTALFNTLNKGKAEILGVLYLTC